MTQFVFNQKGRKTAVIVPIREWEAMQAEINKQRVLQGLKEAYVEMEAIEKEGRPGKSRQQVMDDIRNVLHED